MQTVLGQNKYVLLVHLFITYFILSQFYPRLHRDFWGQSGDRRASYEANRLRTALEEDGIDDANYDNFIL